MQRFWVRLFLLLSATGVHAQSPLQHVTQVLSQPIVRSDVPKTGPQFVFEWYPSRYDFSGPWTGATEYRLVAERSSGLQVQGWSGQYELDPADLLYPVSVEDFVPELGVYFIRARCAEPDCTAMSGRRLGWVGQNMPGDLDDPAMWEIFSNTPSGIIFAVGDCETAHETSAQMNLLLQSQGAAQGREQVYTPCPDVTPLAMLDPGTP